MTKSYRLPEIEYLRAIAVLVVILNHLEVLPGGFIGVDIFFVISGFVISQALHESECTSILSCLKQFYYRRIIRIIPPLIVVTLGSFAFGWWLFHDADFERLQQAIAHQAFFLQNVYFVETVSDYFRGIPSTQLTLHTWSLAVEEQFYLLYPLLFLVVFRGLPIAGRISTAVMIALTALAAHLSIFSYTGLERMTVGVLRQFLSGGIDTGPVRFYSISFRAWQFLLGWSAFALKGRLASMPQWRRGSTGYRRLVFYIGAAALCAFTLIDLHAGTWPNAYTVAVCGISAVSLVATGFRDDGACVRNPVSSVMLYLGNTSYSAYLWHWPVLGYFVYTNFDFGDAVLDYVLFFATLGVLVAATYHTVEKHRFRISPGYSAVLLVAFVGGMAGLGAIERDHAWFSDTKRHIFATSEYDGQTCEFDVSEVGRPFVVLFGDSHAQMVRGAFKSAAKAAGFDVLCIEGSRAALSVSRTDTERARAGRDDRRLWRHVHGDALEHVRRWLPGVRRGGIWGPLPVMEWRTAPNARGGPVVFRAESRQPGAIDWRGADAEPDRASAAGAPDAVLSPEGSAC